MENEFENKNRNSKNKFELEGNVASIGNIYTSQSGKKVLRFDLGQNNNGYNQYVPIVIRGKLADTYGNEIKKGDWISVKGRIVIYSKEIEKDGKIFKDKVVEILGFEITDIANNKIYTSDGQVHTKASNKEETEMER